jgi:hypothetical protein
LYKLNLKPKRENVKMDKFQKPQNILFLLLVVLLFGCGKNNENVVIINIDEIKDITTEKFTELRIVDNKGDTIYFGNIADIFLGADSDIMIIEREKSRIVQLDKGGNFKRYIGRPGGGPGEFISPSIGIYYNDNHYIVDNYAQLLQKFDKDMEYITSYRIRLTAASDIAFINENEIVAINYDESDEHIFFVIDTLGSIIRSFGDIKGNEEGIMIKGKQRRSSQIKFVYDPLYKHIFLVSVGAPIIRRFDLNGNLLQRINFEGNRIDKLNVTAEEARQNASSTSIEAGTFYLLCPSIIEEHKLLVTIGGFGSLVLHYDENNIIDTKLIKHDIITEDKIWRWALGLEEYNNMKFLYDIMGQSFVSTD